MSNGVDTEVQAVQPPGPDASVDRVLSQPQLAELWPRHNPVLSFGQTRDPSVGAASLL